MNDHSVEQKVLERPFLHLLRCVWQWTAFNAIEDNEAFLGYIWLTPHYGDI